MLGDKMIKKIIPIIMLILMSLSVLASTLSYNVPTSTTPGATFQVTYTMFATVNEEFVAWSNSVSGGCSPNLNEDFMVRNGAQQEAMQTKTATFTAPSSGSCTFTGYYAFGGEAQQTLQQKTITISGPQPTPTPTPTPSPTPTPTPTASITSATYSGAQTIYSGTTFTIDSRILSSSGCPNCVFRAYLVDQHITPFSVSAYVNTNTCGLTPSWFYRDNRYTIYAGDTANIQFGFTAQEVGTYDVFVEVLTDCLSTTPIASYKVIDNLRIVDEGFCTRCTSDASCSSANVCAYGTTSTKCDVSSGLCFTPCTQNTFKCLNNVFYGCSANGNYDTNIKTCNSPEYCNGGTISSSSTCLSGTPVDTCDINGFPQKQVIQYFGIDDCFTALLIGWFLLALIATLLLKIVSGKR